ncbi:nucleotidyltransferase domain-containing protein [Candidatus Woesearchaeota archaeon]|nr:nucleotidyltransferase domain-containing protein [Candidatus Woesearchaeota archaeon]
MIRKYALFKVFECLSNTTEEESVRSLAKKAGVGVATAKRCFDYLLKKGIVKRKVIGRLYQFRLDDENILTRQLKISLSIAGITESGLVDELTAAYPQITSITLFGSVAKGTDNPSSDIDILIISRKPIRLKPLAAEKRLERELSVVKYVHPDWRKKAKIDKAFYDGVIIEGMSLYGELPVVK